MWGCDPYADRESGANGNNDHTCNYCDDMQRQFQLIYCGIYHTCDNDTVAEF
jgi:hypothetical protein